MEEQYGNTVKSSEDNRFGDPKARSITEPVEQVPESRFFIDLQVNSPSVSPFVLPLKTAIYSICIYSMYIVGCKCRILASILTYFAIASILQVHT